MDGAIEIGRSGRNYGASKRRAEKDRATGVCVRQKDAGYRIQYPPVDMAFPAAEVARILVHDRGKEKVAQETGNVGIQFHGAQTLSIIAPTFAVATKAIAGGMFQRRSLKRVQTDTPWIIGALEPFVVFLPRSQGLEFLLVSDMESGH